MSDHCSSKQLQSKAFSDKAGHDAKKTHLWFAIITVRFFERVRSTSQQVTDSRLQNRSSSVTFEAHRVTETVSNLVAATLKTAWRYRLSHEHQGALKGVNVERSPTVEPNSERRTFHFGRGESALQTLSAVEACSWRPPKLLLQLRHHLRPRVHRLGTLLDSILHVHRPKFLAAKEMDSTNTPSVSVWRSPRDGSYHIYQRCARLVAL